jgi:hypothetical protein
MKFNQGTTETQAVMGFGAFFWYFFGRSQKVQKEILDNN